MANKYEYVRKSIAKRRKWYSKLKEHPCTDCGISYPYYVMDFHHRNPDDKSFQLGRGCFRNSKEKILKEIKKCDLLCANCHRIREYKDKAI